jgi:molybdenum cofactor guanylyltransferase
MRREGGVVAGVVLAGGKSSRLGQDKTRIVFSGASLLVRAVDLLKRHCPTVCVVGRSTALDAPGVRCYADHEPGRGPAGGIATALRILKQPCLVLSCDLPLMDDRTIRRLLAGWHAKPEQALMTTFQQVETGYIEALVSVYEPLALPRLEQAFAQSLYQLNRILPQAVRHHLPYLRSEATAFFNVNHPADLSMLRSMEAMGGYATEEP